MKDWREIYGRHVGVSVRDAETYAVAETPVGAPRPNEKLVQWIWREQLLEVEALVCIDGRHVTVVSPGEVVGGHGPDFRNAVLEVGGMRLCGDVEIHVQSRDWHSHRHSSDFAYNRVVLHAFLWGEQDDPKYEELHNGVRVPKMELGNFLEPDFETLSRCFASGDLGEQPGPVAGDDVGADDADEESPAVVGVSPEVPPCRGKLLMLDAGQRDELLRNAGRHRMAERIERFARLSDVVNMNQVLWEALLSSLAHGRSRPLMFALAGRVPLDELADLTGGMRDDVSLAAAVESVLMHVAGLMPAADSGPELSGEATAWLGSARQWWGGLAELYGDRVMKPNKFWHSGMRPQNFPERRLAGVARLLARRNFRHGLLDSFVGEICALKQSEPQKLSEFRVACNTLINNLTVGGDDSFWSRHYTLVGKTQPIALQLIGVQQASSVVYNVILPLCILHARQRQDHNFEHFVWRLISHWSRLPDNRTVRLMSAKLFGDSGTKPRFEIHQQALIQIHQDCCVAMQCKECILNR